MDFKRKIYKNRIKLDDICLENVNPSNPADSADIKGSIAEEMVRDWLSRIYGLKPEKRLPKYCNDYMMEENNPSILISRLNYEGKKHHKADIDQLIHYKSRLYAVEVKSMKLNGVQSKIKEKIEYTQMFYDKRVNMLLFFPFYTNKEKHINALEKDFPNLTCIDTGYKKKQINNMIEKYINII
ncbi:MAG: hypothetical protein ACOCQG_01585 [Candidatus Nanoarchaeia archaeon]